MRNGHPSDRGANPNTWETYPAKDTTSSEVSWGQTTEVREDETETWLQGVVTGTAFKTSIENLVFGHQVPLLIHPQSHEHA